MSIWNQQIIEPGICINYVKQTPTYLDLDVKILHFVCDEFDLIDLHAI